MSALLQVVRTGQPRTIRLVGELDASNADDLLIDLDPELASGGDLTLDLGALDFIDSVGLRSFVRVAHALDGGRLILREPQPGVGRTLDIVGIDKTNNIFVTK
ncbi:MAG TPA: STAS domain-containing protein [Actinomycetota bacterium]|nr:STAS domain-containing protein [Actinomycetota bacterium]